MTAAPRARDALSVDDAFAADVRAGLTAAGQKRLAPKYLYDALGSALFDAITQLPEYGLWRAERRLLERHAAEMATRAAATHVIELGSGSASKTTLLLTAAAARGRSVDYCAIDISAAALASTRLALAGIAGVHVRTLEGLFDAGIDGALAARRGPVLVLLLGSSLGNFDATASRALLARVRASLRPGDHLLLGNDLRKAEPVMLAAYDDPLGVTAAFNLNVLARSNRELGTDFTLRTFRHRARYNRDTHNVEMHVESLVDQVVHGPGWEATLRAGETIHTENSHKYAEDEIDALLDASGFRVAARWVDAAWPFASTLCAVKPA
ncbi:MAG: L-histidine N(alpha)-methyltransferase [Proteobacteria bacterium]|nr:L-histidine N(alpha)-methyltransferase [Pseudomonadota bacterium]